jgi:dihydroxyacetone kinase-like protein
MRKLLNDPYAIVDEMVDGIAAAHPRLIELTPSRRGIVATARAATRKVGVVVGGGSGHEPAFFGFVGPGFADGAAVGNVFASPSARPIVEVAERVNRDHGVLFLYGNYLGDTMNFEMAGELLEDKGIETKHLAVTDDIASAPAAETYRRRGVAGDVLVLKVVGARADEGAALDEVHAAGVRGNRHTCTIGVGLGPCIVPAVGRPTFELPEGAMDIGMGVHGEAGLRRGPLAAADEVADLLLDRILAELHPTENNSVFVLVNTLGATPAMEAYVVLRRVLARLSAIGINVHRARVGEFVTSLEMSGLSLTLMALDDELQRLIDAPGRTLAMPALEAPW